MDEEIQLINECLRGKRLAQKELYDRFSEQMLGVCYRYTKCRADAEEVLQIGFIKVFKYLEQFRWDGDLGAWIRRIMVNSAINYLKRKPQYQLDLSFDENPLHPVDTREPDAQLNLKDLLRLILQLPVGYQTIFNLHAIEGYTHVEIAKLLGIHEGTSRSQYARARALLINWLDQSSVNHKKNTYVR